MDQSVLFPFLCVHTHSSKPLLRISKKVLQSSTKNLILSYSRYECESNLAAFNDCATVKSHNLCSMEDLNHTRSDTMFQMKAKRVWNQIQQRATEALD